MAESRSFHRLITLILLREGFHILRGSHRLHPCHLLHHHHLHRIRSVKVLRPSAERSELILHPHSHLETLHLWSICRFVFVLLKPIKLRELRVLIRLKELHKSLEEVFLCSWLFSRLSLALGSLCLVRVS